MNEEAFEYVNVCLRRISSGNKKYAVIPLEDKKVIIGRSLDATFNILSDKISRQHAILSETEDGEWIIMDNKSLNGVIINEIKLKPMETKILKEGDTVQFGIKTNDHGYIYKFCRNLKVSRQALESDGPPNKKIKIEHSNADVSGPSTSSFGDVNGLRTKPSSNASSRSESPLHIFEHSYCTATINSSNSDPHMLNTAMDLSSLHTLSATSHEDQYSQRTAHNAEFGEPSSSCGHSSGKWNCENMPNAETLALKRKLEEMELLIAQKDAELNRLQQNKHHTTDEGVIEDEEGGTSQLLPVNVTQECGNDDEITQHDDTDHSFNKLCNPPPRDDVCDKVETELTCSICSELFIQSVTLNCGHSYCQYCIKQWKCKSLQRAECPMCRTLITSETHSVSVDAVISLLIEQMNDEARQTRQEVLDERRMLEVKANQTSTGIPKSVRFGVDIPIVISDSEDETDSPREYDDDGTDFSEDSDRDRSLSSFGRCNICGQRGHWAPACPH